MNKWVLTLYFGWLLIGIVSLIATLESQRIQEKVNQLDASFEELKTTQQRFEQRQEEINQAVSQVRRK